MAIHVLHVIEKRALLSPGSGLKGRQVECRILISCEKTCFKRKTKMPSHEELDEF